MGPEKTASEHHNYLIIGAGFGGLGVAINLLEDRDADFVIIERAPDVGGCWQANRYPGVCCDIPSVLYSFSFAPNPDWSHTYSSGAEIQRYLADLTDRYGIRPHVRFNTRMLSSVWDDDAKRWTVQTSAGLFTADVLITAHGALSAPKKPNIPGFETFKGRLFHSAEWPADAELKGKRVAIVGTGASAIQIIPQIQPVVDTLTVYQRNAPYVIPRGDREMSAWRRNVFRKVPAVQKTLRAFRFGRLDLNAVAFMGNEWAYQRGLSLAKGHLNDQVSNLKTRETLTPKYRLGCKRVLLSDEYYPALEAPNATLVNQRAATITETGIVDATGTFREADIILLCTGFDVAEHPVPKSIIGRSGETLADHMRGGCGAYLGMTVPDFPNLFLMITGPHTGLGHNSILYLLEAQLKYLKGALAAYRESDGVMEVRREAAVAFSEEMQASLEGTVWGTGCTSFYLDIDGKNIGIWPGTARSYWTRMKDFDAAPFRFSG